MDETKFEYSYENSIKTLENQLAVEKRFPTLIDQLNIQSNIITVSGLRDGDYPVVNEYIGGCLKVIKTHPIPFILKEQTNEMKQNFIMKTFVNIDRLCLTVDSKLFLWNYDSCGEPEYYNGIPDTIISLNLIKPKHGVFYNSINYLLVVCTQIEILILGVTVACLDNNLIEFTREPLFRLSTDNEEVSVVESIDGRIFLGTQSGKILELSYWTEKPSWFSMSKSKYYCNTKYAYEPDWRVYLKLIDHTSWMLSMFLPSIIVNGLSNTDSIIQIATDSTRNCFYTLSDNSTITEYHILPNDSLKRGNYVTESSIISKISKIISSMEHTQFKNIVHLAPFPVGYGMLKLMAVTQNGIRMYFLEDLRLCHVRIPPVNSLAVCGKISNVRHCCESRGSILMTSGPQGHHTLYAISPDQFISNDLIETVSLTWLQQTCWSLEALDKTNCWKQAGPPIIQTQHIDPIRKFILLTSDNVLTLELASPIHQLRSLIEKSSQSKEIKNWINHYGLDETIYGALVLGMDTKKSNPTLSNKAIDMVIYYLTENVNMRMHNIQNCGYKYDIVNPLHNLLYLYTARIMRPLWDSSIIEQIRTNESTNIEQYETTHDFDQLRYYICHLVHLHDFIRDNYPRLKSIDSMNFPNLINNSLNDLTNPSLLTTNIVPISLTLELLELLKISIEIVGLWRLMTEHQFNKIITFISPDIRKELLMCPVKNLLVPTKRYLLLSLISALLEYYLEDGSSTESIIETLLQVCPNIYRIEDAMCSKANELLVTIDSLITEPGMDEEKLCQKKNAILLESISYYEKVGPLIDLGNVINRLLSVSCIWGAVHLCLHTAKLRDPDEIAFICLKEGRRPQTLLEINAVEGRNDAYKHMLECLTKMLNLCNTEFGLNESITPMSLSESRNIDGFPSNSALASVSNMIGHENRSSIGNQGDIGLNRTNGPDQSVIGQTNMGSGSVDLENRLLSGTVNQNDALNELRIILSSILSNTTDIMAHYEVYSWMMENNMSSEILKYEPAEHLESFLQRCLQQELTNFESIVDVKTLLWRHYEILGRYFEAAKVLDNLAVSENIRLNLDDRIECLSRAIVFMKAVMGDRQFVDSDFLKELEDKVDIANLQKVIIDEVGAFQTEVCKELSSQIFNVYTLLKDYVEPLDLTISKLCILKISGNQDVSKARLVWEDVLRKEIDKAEDEVSKETKANVLKQGINHVITTFKENISFIPLDLVLYHLECYSQVKEFAEEWSVNCIMSAGISLDRIIIAYGEIVKMKNPEVKKYLNRIYKSICYAFDYFIHQDDNRSKYLSHGHLMVDVITNCLIQLQSRPDHSSSSFINKLKGYQLIIEKYI